MKRGFRVPASCRVILSSLRASFETAGKGIDYTKTSVQAQTLHSVASSSLSNTLCASSFPAASVVANIANARMPFRTLVCIYILHLAKPSKALGLVFCGKGECNQSKHFATDDDCVVFLVWCDQCLATPSWPLQGTNCCRTGRIERCLDRVMPFAISPKLRIFS